jgi:serine beta-lactamase-like protein LACTB
MTRNSNIFLLALLCFLSISCLQAEKKDPVKSSVPDYSATIRFTEKRVKQIKKKLHLPGFSIVIVDDQDTIYKSFTGLADVEKNITITNDTYFKVWSIAKAFTAIEIFREVEEGMIDLDLPLSTYLPDFNIHSRYGMGKPITVRNILAHRSGLPRNECVSVLYKATEKRSLEKFEQSIHDCYMSFPPETRYKYSNLGYDLLGRIVEESRDIGFSRYMDEKLLKTIGMTKSTFSSGNISRSEVIATGYEYYKGKYYPRNQIEDISSVPSGNLYTTIGDLSNFLKGVFANKDIFNQDATLARMLVDHYSRKKDPETMGLGFKTSKILGSEQMIWHDGGPGDGTGALIAFLPERKLGIALISNSTGFGGNISVPLAVEIFDKLLIEKFGFEVEKAGKRKKVKLDLELLHKYEGKYPAFSEIMDVKAKNNKLKGEISGIGLDLIPVGDTKFKISHWMHRIGLTKIIKPPIDFDKVKVEFVGCELSDSCTMIINLDNISYEVCSKYPSVQDVPEAWSKLIGEYQIAERLSGNRVGDLWNGKYNITIDNNVMSMSHPFGPIIPLTDNYIIISSGPFAGETMEYSRESGNIIHQNAVFTPIE